MQFSTIIAVAVALLTPVAFAAPIESRGGTGTMTIVNKCKFPIVLNIANQVGLPPPPPRDIPAGGHYTEAMMVTNHQGNTWKLSLKDAPWPPPVTQVEYTIGTDKLWWDLSLIDGNPLIAGLQTMKSDCKTEGFNHREVSCAAGVFPCKDAYITSTDDVQGMRDSLLGSNLVYTACA